MNQMFGPADAGGTAERPVPRRWTRVEVLRYALVGIALVGGFWYFNLIIAIASAAVLYFIAPYLAHPGDALRYLRLRRKQRRYLAALDSEHGEVISFGNSDEQIRRAVTGEIKPFRVFVSSTFQDLTEERDLLAKDVFPRLATACDRRGALWAPVDLRWGITELEQNAGEVIRICLDSVERSWPNTIGIVGTRYGTHLPFSASDLESLPPWVTHTEGLSVTHLELRHASHPDPSAVSVFVMDTPRDDFAEEEGIETMLTELGEEGAHILTGIADPHALAALVEADLMRRLDEQVPDSGLDNRMLREISAHNLRERILAERPVLNAEVHSATNRHLTEVTVVVLRGAPGSGRSTQLAAWAHAWREQHPGDVVVCRFVGLTDASQTWTQVLRSIVAEISIRTGQPMRLPERDEELAMSAAFRFLETQSVGRVVVGVDGIDRFQSRGVLDHLLAHSLAWVPQQGSQNRLMFVPLVATDDLCDEPTFACPVAMVQLPPLAIADRSRLVDYSLQSVDRRLPDQDIEAIVAHPETGHPAFLGLLLDELHKAASHEQVGHVLRGLLSAQSLDELVDKSLDRVERELGTGKVPGLHAVLALLAESRIGYTSIEIVDIVSRIRPGFSQTEFETLRWRLASLLSEADGAYLVTTPFAQAIKRRTTQPDLDAELCRARVGYFAYGSPRFTTRTVSELADIPIGEELGVVRDIVAEPRGLLALRSAFGSAHASVLGAICERTNTPVAEVLGEAAAGAREESDRVRLGVAEVCFTYGRYDLTMRTLDYIPRQGIADDASLFDGYLGLLGKLDLVRARPLQESEWEEIFDQGRHFGTANVQLALSGFGAAATARGDFFWAGKYHYRALDVAFASGDIRGVAVAGINSAITQLEGISDPLRTHLGPMLRTLFDAGASSAFNAGDMQLIVACIFRRSVMDLVLGDAKAAHDGFALVDETAKETGDERYLGLTRLALNASLTALGRRNERLDPTADLSADLDDAAAVLEREVLTLLV